MRKIYANLWYDTDAKGAVALYKKAFHGVKDISSTVLEGTPSGDVDTYTIELGGFELLLMSAGPYFTFTPATSLMIRLETAEEVERAWNVLIEGGAPLMPLGEYPFSKKYGWLKDKYGLSWQLGVFGGDLPEQRLIPTLMFVGAKAGKAEEAMQFYLSVFGDAKVLGEVARYPGGNGPDKQGTVMHAEFTLEGVHFAAMDSAMQHNFDFTEAVSFIVRCKDQQEIDAYWEKLSAVPEAEQCGWLKDKYGVSWQIVPEAMDEMMRTKDKAALKRVTEAFLKMKKFDLAALERAYKGA